ncbi:MAG: glutamine synthetase family protein [Candidatus Thorarchaeota archaeon]
MTDFIKIFEDNNIDYIQFHFTTLLGKFKVVEFPAEIWNDMRNGTGIDGSSLGFLKTEQSDMKIIPDFDTFNILPWNKRIARFICDITDNHGNSYSLCPRGILKNILKKAASIGYKYMIRPELEWYFMTINKMPVDNAQYMDMPPKDKYSNLRRTITDDMIKMKIGIKTIHHEAGPGQQEVEFLADEALRQADNLQTAKMIIKIDSFNQNIISSFMPKPFEKEAGSGLRIHQYLMNDGKNYFTDEIEQINNNLRYFIGGIQKFSAEITAILNPTTNSYRRLIPDHEAPVYNSWGIGNRTALLRVPGYDNLNRVEYRGGDASMNIYLGATVLLTAGLEGIKNEIEPNIPTNKNVDTMSPEERQKYGINPLPRSLELSLNALNPCVVLL